MLIQNKQHFCILILVIIISLLFHSSLYFIINVNQYNFYDTDTWYSIRQIDRQTHGENIEYDSMLNYPEGRSIDWGIALPIFYSLFVNKYDSTLEIFNKVGFLPPILSALFVLLIYFLVSKLFSETVGFYSSILLSIGTGIYFQNCLFGVIDHHLLESILFAIMILCFLLMIKEKLILWSIPIFISGTILFFTSVLWVFFYGVFVLCLMILFLYKFWNIWCISIIIPIVISVAFYVKDTYWFRLLYWVEPISEIANSDILLLIIRFNILIPILLCSIILYIKFLKKEFTITCLLLISFILAILTCRFTRMEYLLTPFILILSAYFIDKFFTNKISTIIILVFLIISSVVGGIIIMDLAKTANDNSEWNGALSYIRDQEEGLVLSWWDYGHWIVAVSGQPPFADPFQARVVEAAKIFTGKNDLELSKYRYIIVTKNDYKFYDAMVWYSKSPVPYENSYLKKLICEETNDKLVFKNALIRIYDVWSNH